jgi:hypothetical protein
MGIESGVCAIDAVAHCFGMQQYPLSIEPAQDQPVAQVAAAGHGFAAKLEGVQVRLPL